MSEKQIYTWEKDIEPHFSHFIPSMLKILEPSKSKIRTIEKKYNERFGLEKESIKKNGIFEAEASVFDLFWKAKDGDKTCNAILRFIEATCASLLAILIPADIPKIRNTCFQAIVNFDDSTSRYLCFVGELASLERILSDDKNTLEGIEYKLSNGKSFDFAINIGSSLHLIEVSNLFLDENRLGSEEEFANFLEQRYVTKLMNKIDETHPNTLNFALLPILWVKESTLHQYISYFRTFSPPKKVVLPPMLITSLRHIVTGEVTFIYVDVKQYLERMAKK